MFMEMSRVSSSLRSPISVRAGTGDQAPGVWDHMVTQGIRHLLYWITQEHMGSGARCMGSHWNTGDQGPSVWDRAVT